jgi:hypothetical protein
MDFALATAALLATCLAIVGKAREKIGNPKSYLSLTTYSWGAIALAVLSFSLQVWKASQEVAAKNERLREALVSLQQTTTEVAAISAGYEHLNLPRMELVPRANKLLAYAPERIQQMVQVERMRRSVWQQSLPSSLLDESERLFVKVNELAEGSKKHDWSDPRVASPARDVQALAAELNSLICKYSVKLGTPLGRPNKPTERCSESGVEWLTAEDLLTGKDPFLSTK